MLYTTYNLFVTKETALKLHTVDVEQGRVVSFFPFSGEQQSMLLVDSILLSSLPGLESKTFFSLEELLSSCCNVSEVSPTTFPNPLYAYEIKHCGSLLVVSPCR